MSQPADAAPGSAASGGVPGSTQSASIGGTDAIRAVVNEELNKAIGPVTRRLQERLEQSLSEVLARALDSNPAKAQGEHSVATPEKPPSNNADGEKLTMKTLYEQIAAERNARLAAEKKTEEANQRAIDAKKRQEVQTHFARHVGGDSPHLIPYVNQYLPQFDYADGSIVRKTKGQYGEELVLPVDKAVDELFSVELKHLVQQSKADKLPPSTWQRGATSQQVKPPPGVQYDPLRELIGNTIAQTHPEIGNAIAASAFRPNGQK